MSNDKTIISLVVPTFSGDAYSEGAAFVLDRPVGTIDPEDRLRFKCAFHATWQLIFGVRNGVGMLEFLERYRDLAEMRAQLELAEATISTLREDPLGTAIKAFCSPYGGSNKPYVVDDGGSKVIILPCYVNEAGRADTILPKQAALAYAGEVWRLAQSLP